MRIHSAAGLKSILLAFVITLSVPNSSYPQLKPISSTPSLEDLRARNIKIKTIQGKRIELNSLLGKGKPVILNIWATWCGPCRQEIPHLINLAKVYRKDGLIVIGLTYEDPKDDLKAVKEFIDEFSINYEVAFTPLALYEFFNGRNSDIRIPQTMVFHSNGTMIKRVIGYDDRDGGRILQDAATMALQPVN